MLKIKKEFHKKIKKNGIIEKLKIEAENNYKNSQIEIILSKNE